MSVFYRSLEEYEKTKSFRADCEKEFKDSLPVGSGVGDEVLSRRDFLKAMGFSTAAVAAASCSPMPVEKAIPYLLPSEQITPGKATWYSSTCNACPSQCGMIVKTREGRPIKIEGNPDSPLNQGGLCAVGQADVLDLYDSGRLQGPRLDGRPSTWAELDQRVSQVLVQLGEKKARIRLLTKTITSPTFQDVIRRFQQKFPGTVHVTYDAVSVSGLLDAHDLAFGLRFLPHYHFDQADLVVSLGADFLGAWISPVEFAKQVRERRVPNVGGTMSRHIQFESRLSLTGANADERILMKPSEEKAVALALWSEITGKKVSGTPLPSERLANLSRVVNELKSKRGKSLVISGSNDRDVQLAVLAINEALGNYGVTLDCKKPSLQKQGSDAGIQALLRDLKNGLVDVLIVYGCNPIYELPDGSDVALKNVKLTVSLSGRLDETAALAQVLAPDHHNLEAWNDSEPIRGLYHFAQPMIAPVYSTRHAGESLMAWMGAGGIYEAAMKAYWARRTPGFARFWQQTLRTGVFADKSVGASSLPKMNARVQVLLAKAAARSVETSDALELEVFESVMLRDGRHANNPWLQETPDPITKVTWGNAVQMSVADGQKLGLSQGDVIGLSAGHTSLELPVVLQPGQMQGTISVALGYGRKAAGKVGNGVGQNAFLFAGFNASGRLYSAPVKLAKTGRREALTLTQIHYSLEDRPLVKDLNLSDLEHEGHDAGESYAMLWKEHESKGHAWGLAIDLSACNGCSACLVSCQAENNVPVVGKDEVFRQREMHWIRIDRYYKGNLENPDVVFEPMLCQHCGNAPCESVCPVLATVHSSDGLNQQVYNRCVGTRYCANNCPYKVRRFNWFDYVNNPRFDFHMNDPIGKLVLNPDVTVRSRGVIEKCSLCVQRIQEEKFKAKSAGKPLNSEQIKTACQQSCPTDAIVFGDRNDPESRLSKLTQKNPRAFRVLEELNVKPAITYLAKVRNRD